MFKQFRAVKALALAAVITTSGQLLAGGGAPAGPTTGGTPGGTPGIGVANVGAYAYTSAATTSSSVVTEASVMALKTTKILGLVGAVTAEAVEAMRGGGNVSTTDGGVKVAGSSGSNHRASAWLRASHGAIDNSTYGQSWNGHSYLMMLGADYRFNNMFCAGLGLSYSRLDARTEFNNGTLQQDTFGINPYFIIVPHKNFNVEFIGGASWTKAQDMRRWVVGNMPGANPNVDNKFTASPKSQAVFGGVFANFINTSGKANYSLQVGYLMMQSKMGAFTEKSADAAYNSYAGVQKANTFKAGTATGKIVVGYQMTPSVTPFLAVHGQYDAQENKGVEYADNQPKVKVSRSAFGGGTGFSVKGDDNLSGSLQFDYTKRGDLTTYVTGLRAHYSF